MKRLKIIWMLCLALSAGSFTSCSDDDGVGGTMVINNVYLEDVTSSVPDRLVTFARLGQLIRIEGSGFTGLLNIYINGYDTYFNNALLTDNNIWVTLNTNTPIYTAADSVRNTIVLVKTNGARYTYSFEIRSAAPSITEILLTLPQVGELVTVKGSNLQEISRITLPGGVIVTDGIYSDPGGAYFTFTMPSGVTEAGAITAVGANGTAISPASFNNNDCYIINFDGLGVQGSWSATYGASDLVDDPLSSGRGKVAMLIPQSRLDAGGVNAGVSNIPGYWTAGNGEPTDDWNRMTAYIPGETLLSNLALQFDIYCPEAWNLTGQLEITLQNNLSTYGWASTNTRVSTSYTNQACVWVPWMSRTSAAVTGAFQTSGWQTVTLPLTWFGNYSGSNDTHTFQNLIDDRNSGSYRNFGFLFCNGDIDFDGDATTTGDIFTSSLCQLKIYLDNFRIVPNATSAVSDYPDDK